MAERPRSLILTIAIGILMVFWPAVSKSDQDILAARDAILKATQQALTVLLAHNGSRDIAILHPDFIRLDHTGKPLRQTEEDPWQWGFVMPQTFVADEGRTERMQLIAATSTIINIAMPFEDEAVVIGKDVLRWQGKHGEDIRQMNAEGSVAMIGNTEVRTVTVHYRRHWIKDNQGNWRLKRAQIKSEHIVAVL